MKVEGESCWPELVPGKSYLASSLLTPRKGDFIVFREAGEILVKKITSLSQGIYHAGGTVSWSSSHHVLPGQILGRLIH